MCSEVIWEWYGKRLSIFSVLGSHVAFWLMAGSMAACRVAIGYAAKHMTNTLQEKRARGLSRVMIFLATAVVLPFSYRR